MKSVIMIASLTILLGCSASKNNQKIDPPVDNSKEITEMTAQGFLMGTIKTYATEGNCPYVIEVAAETPYFFDPINLEESYKKNDTKVWFKFAGLRMMNRCEKANPVSILEMRKRAE